MKLAHRLALATACATFVLVIAGGMVTSTGSGLATTEPVAIDGWGGTRNFEHGHRVIGWAVGFLVLLTAIAFGRNESRPWVRRLAVGALVAVAVQGMLGMLTVKFELQQPIISIIHAGTAQITFCMLVALAIVSATGWKAPRHRRIAMITMIVIFVQILLGAWYRHTNAGIALAFHVVGVLAVGAQIFMMREARLLHILFFLQLLLGPLSLILSEGKQIVTTGTPLPLAQALPITAHVATGALMMAAATYYLLRTSRGEEPETELEVSISTAS